MGEKEPQATRRSGVLDGSSIFFLSRESGKWYSSILSPSPVIACKTVDRLCKSEYVVLWEGRRKGEENDWMAETSGVDLSGKTVFTVVLGTGESGGGVAADRGRWPDERKRRSDDGCESCVLVEDVG